MSGRGAYYKNLYGSRRGRGRGGGPAEAGSARGAKRRNDDDSGRSAEDLVRELKRLDGKSYPAYRDVQGSWDYSDPPFRLHIDHVQSDPFAPPSKVRIRVPQAAAQLPPSLFANRTRQVALCDFLARRLHDAAVALSKAHGAQKSRRWAGAKGGELTADRPGQQVLERSAVVLDASDGALEARFTVGFPAQGRTILGEWAAEIFRASVPALARTLLYDAHKESVHAFVDSVEDQECLRRAVTEAGLVAFVADGAVLPRASGASDAPMRGPHVVPFRAPPALARTFALPHRGSIAGMGIPVGITMVAGGGFHGKSTLLDALAVGCYSHVPGDGREFVVTSEKCVSVQGEDGRSIQCVDISPFIHDLPGGASTAAFSTQDASGSTSMAAGVVEALELGADTLLFDEDTCATNFLVRDLRMRRLIEADPINPLIFKIRAMLQEHRCSSILVIGGCGDYCDVADLVLEMRQYQCYDITEKAREIAQEIPSVVSASEMPTFGAVRLRRLDTKTLPSPSMKAAVRRRAAIDVGDETLDLTKVAQLVHDSQSRAIVMALKFLHTQPPGRTLSEYLVILQSLMDDASIDALMEDDRIDGFLARPRTIEVGMAINRLVSPSEEMRAVH
ncbi:hypothetical protein WOLCODRAFT_148538 [Wolfiporia cocos MD-104 SS10]|uniref:ABC transporter ATPase n=1 Tax=Wolfiporia cocos (strain MD-104) TaxID=742152 RepID=A0A2H3JET0_WOLCO|nr:hypothetical protein WOLCODRAFT_148538 [Wolfiporia cocos MD-104 SS10]